MESYKTVRIERVKNQKGKFQMGQVRNGHNKNDTTKNGQNQGERKRLFPKTQNATPKFNAKNANRSPLIQLQM